ncbi:alpha/beta-hydrolase [Coniochaeta ligniaria NRRL 30616]|uniref:Alpha/beta-hydrolase n=1 Tax=Coniochaeta ligniaria NRRL 30616 TaxID=1408157 RepID=A0A1J7I919_9PEZI|nr:alpha/beta-hydrolase [Coniochaeta ligniaria NRRL 30616]
MADAQIAVDTRDKIPVAPLHKKIAFAAATAALQGLLITPAMLIRDAKAYISPPATAPDLVKTYPVRPRLPVRIFFPKSHSLTNPTPLPTLFTIHGGGFVLGSPPDNDGWNRAFASEHSALVIALNYAKAPLNPYPGQTADIEALLLAALADENLPIDSARVAVLGWSAGGNLALSVAQRATVRDRIGAVVPVYPVCDFSVPAAAKPASRRYKPSLGGFRARETDYLLAMAPLFDWAYCPAGGDARDPGLSVGYVEREALPKRVFVLGCELDMLAHEDWRLVCKLAGRRVEGDVVGGEEVAGKGELVLDDERFFWEVKGKDGSCYRWLLVPDAVHGFDQDLSSLTSDKEMLEDAAVKTEKTRKMIGEWLHDGVFSK